MEKKTILVTGIGGNVGQGIIRNILESNFPVKIIGCNVTEMSAGNHLVDTFYKVPFAYEKQYLTAMLDIVKQENIDLIIPSTDYEIYHLATNKAKFNCKIACAGPIAALAYLDKYNSCILHKKHDIPFSESLLPSEFYGQFSPAIAKPREGRGSKGLLKNYTGSPTLSDKEYMVQPMYIGKEITSAVYATYSDRRLHGVITMERTLENGATTYCKVIDTYNHLVKEIAQGIIDNTDICGAFNIQCIVTETGEIYPFEINCRISGTNSIRSHFGFSDVAWTVEELLFDKKPAPFVSKFGYAHRILSDIIYVHEQKEYDILGNNKDNFKLF